ncbi:hypothetical protein PSP6_700001 [Paraburkholderia tropica]|uniref:hypothetical protein n=1 Tax=Paraburkholderia tropica TaxID=92647 RepID=UPI001CB16F97|nr:hypothetical protein [Paraburkholderia tropica]CAG9236891.1 hypothetical protein PSP6_700001 [Paraburkholderia tropica]
MFNGHNKSNWEYDVIDEDGDVLGSFDYAQDATRCATSAPWYAGEVRIRRDHKARARAASAPVE